MKRKPDSAPTRVLAFLRENADEVLTFSDIATKFDVSVATARTLAYRLQEEGHVSIERVVMVAREKQP